VIAQLKTAAKKILEALHITFRAPVKGVYRKNAGDFFEDLEKSRIEYVILRWYDLLPLVEPGEDFDILVANSDCKKLTNKLKIGDVKNKDFIKCDVYPVNNTKGFLAYYPPFLAERCLEHRVKDKSGVWILEPFTYFCALTYHVVFHKGYSSGLDSKYRNSVIEKPEHDYYTILINLAKSSNIEIEDFSIEGLETFLKNHDWTPPMDIYFRRSQKNEWIKDRLTEIIPSTWYRRRGLVCFVLRELGDNNTWNSRIDNLLVAADARIINRIKLTQEQRRYFAQHTRGGDWGKGPTKKPGGLPSTIIVARKDMNGTDSLPHGVVEYQWVKDIKDTIREDYNKSVPYNQNSNIIHSTDNGIEASYYISVLEKVIGDNYEELL